MSGLETTIEDDLTFSHPRYDPDTEVAGAGVLVTVSHVISVYHRPGPGNPRVVGPTAWDHVTHKTLLITIMCNDVYVCMMMVCTTDHGH